MKRAITLLALGAALVAGCSDDEDSDRRPDFVKEADRICRKSGIRPKAVPNDLTQAAEQLEEEARLRAAVHGQLARIEPTEELREDYRRFVAETDAVARALSLMATFARSGQEGDLAETGRRTGVREAERLRLAERIGFRRCGRPITDPVRGVGARGLTP